MWFNEWFSESPNKVALAKFLEKNNLKNIYLMLDRSSQEICIHFPDEGSDNSDLFLKLQNWFANEEVLNSVTYVSKQTVLSSQLQLYSVDDLRNPSSGHNRSPAKGFKKM